MNANSPDDLVAEMASALHDLSVDVEKYAKQLTKSVEAQNDFREAYAKAYLLETSSGRKATVAEIDARISEQVAPLKRAADIAEALAKATRESMDVDRRRIEVAQSILAFARTELEHTSAQVPLVRDRDWRAI